MRMIFKVISILFFVIIYYVQQSKCSNELLEQLNYNILDDLIAKYSKNEGSDLSDQIFDPAQDQIELKPIGSRVSKANNMYANLDEEIKPMKGNIELNYFNPNNNNNDELFDNHGIRDEEFLEKSSLWGHQSVQGGMGEGEQKLKPDGSISNVQVIKTDSIIPSYCTPPNPCPLGYTSDDGCLEQFKNTASFSRDYQSMQDCICDSEHMFNCDSNDGNKMRNDKTYQREEEEERELNTIARSLANQPISEDAADRFIDALVNHKVVAKKFFAKENQNLFLRGERLPIVAKKSPIF